MYFLLPRILPLWLCPQNDTYSFSQVPALWSFPRYSTWSIILPQSKLDFVSGLSHFLFPEWERLFSPRLLRRYSLIILCFSLDTISSESFCNYPRRGSCTTFSGTLGTYTLPPAFIISVPLSVILSLVILFFGIWNRTQDLVLVGKFYATELYPWRLLYLFICVSLLLFPLLRENLSTVGK